MPGIVKILFERKDWCVSVSRVGPLGLISLKLGLPFSKINISSLNSLRKIGQYTQHFGLVRNSVLIEQCHSIAIIVPWCVQLVSDLLVWCHRNVENPP